MRSNGTISVFTRLWPASFSKAFFPPGDDAAALLATFAVFGLGFVVRPIGAAVLGRLGDVVGRKIALVISRG
jgi:MFS transporter, MHS family, alpha-ketoglutarate permease